MPEWSERQMERDIATAEDWKKIFAIPWPPVLAACLTAAAQKCGPITAEEISAAADIDLNGFVAEKIGLRINIIFTNLELPYRFLSCGPRGNSKRSHDQQFCMIKKRS